VKRGYSGLHHADVDRCRADALPLHDCEAHLRPRCCKFKIRELLLLLPSLLCMVTADLQRQAQHSLRLLVNASLQCRKGRGAGNKHRHFVQASVGWRPIPPW